jgi:hypothetical protein
VLDFGRQRTTNAIGGAQEAQVKRTNHRGSARMLGCSGKPQEQYCGVVRLRFAKSPCRIESVV